jgi:hypothetical protein
MPQDQGGGGGGGATKHNLLDGNIDQDTTASAVVQGDLVIGSAAPLWTRLGIGSAGQFLGISAGLPAWSNPSAGALLFGSAVLTAQQVLSSSTFADIPTNPLTITLPSAGTYLLFAMCSFLVGDSNGEQVCFEFYDATNTNAVPNSQTVWTGVATAASGGSGSTLPIIIPYTVTGSVVIHLYAQASYPAGVTVLTGSPTATVIGYVKIA